MKPFWTPCPVLFMALYFKRSPGEKDFCALMNFKYPDSTAKGWHKELYSRSRRAIEGDRSLPDSYSWHPAGLGSILHKLVTLNVFPELGMTRGYPWEME